MKKIILIGLIIVIIITLKVDVVKAENDVSSSQLGFEISKQDYSQFGYIFNKKINSYYEKKCVGTTTYSFAYCRGRRKALNKNEDLCCIRIITEPSSSVTIEKKILFWKKDKTYKFGLSFLQVKSDKTEYGEEFELNNYIYHTTADEAKSEASLSLGAGVSVAGISFSDSFSESVSKSIVDISDKSNLSRLDVKFVMGIPKTNEQSERVYEQTYFYIMQQYLTNRNEYVNKTDISVKYQSGDISVQTNCTIKTNIGYK